MKILPYFAAFFVVALMVAASFHSALAGSGGTAARAGAKADAQLVERMCGVFGQAAKRAECLEAGKTSLADRAEVSTVVRWGCGSIGRPEQLVACYLIAADLAGNQRFAKATAGCVGQTACVYERLGCLVNLFGDYSVAAGGFPQSRARF